MRQCSFRAPNREWVLGQHGWYSQPWSYAGVVEAISGGAWFSSAPDHHEFASPEVRKAALQGGN